MGGVTRGDGGSFLDLVVVPSGDEVVVGDTASPSSPWFPTGSDRG